MADIKEAIRRLIFEYVTEGADKVMATQEAVAASTTKTDKASLSLEKAFGGLERRYVDTVRAQQDYAKVQEKVNAAVAQNPALQERANVLLAAAGEHFDKLALNANKGGIAASILSKAITTILGPAGLLGAAMTAVGVAVGAMASQFQSSSTTIEEALEKTNRLLKEAKTLLDAKASAEAKAFQQSRSTQMFDALQQEIDLREKLQKASGELAALAERKSTVEVGAGLFGTKEGYEGVVAAAAKLRETMAAGRPDITAFNTALSEIALVNPDLAKTVAEIRKVGDAFLPLEQNNAKLQAMAAALAGLATNAEMAAAGLGSLAQHAVNSQMAIEAAAATERQAQAVLALAAAYPGVTIETAKILDNLAQQLPVTEALTGAEKILAQEKATIAKLVGENKTLEEATAIAAAQRKDAEAAVDAQYQKQIKSLNDQAALIKARTDGTYEAVKAQQDYDNAIKAGAKPETAKAFVEAKEAVQDLKQEEKGYWVSRRAEQKSYDTDLARTANAAAQRQQQINAANNAAIDAYNQKLERAQAEVRRLEDYWSNIFGVMVEINKQLEVVVSNIRVKTWIDPGSGRPVQFNPEGYGVYTGDVSATWQNVSKKGTFAADMQKAMEGMTPLAMLERSGVNLDQFVGMQNISSPAAIQQSFENIIGLGFEQGLAPVNRLLEAVADPATQANLIAQTIDRIMATQQPGLAREEMVNELNDKLEQLANSTDSLNKTMQNALSPFYSQDPRTTKLGFRAGVVGNPDWMVGGASNTNPLAAILGPTATVPGMADGGSFVVGGGYSANDNRIAAFPVASGEEVIVNRNRMREGSGNVINIDNRTIVMGSVDSDTMAKLKVTKFQQAQRMRGAMAQA